MDAERPAPTSLVLPWQRLHRAAQRLDLVSRHLEVALTQTEPDDLDARARWAAALASAAVGDVAIATLGAGASTSSAVQERAEQIRVHVSLLRWRFELADQAPSGVVSECLAIMEEALTDIDALLLRGGE